MSSTLQPIYFLVYLDCLHISSVMQGKKGKECVALRSELHKVRKDFSHFQARVTFEVTRDRAYESDGEFILEPNKYNLYRI